MKPGRYRLVIATLLFVAGIINYMDRAALGVAAPSLAGTTLVGGIPMALAAIAILLFGVETRNRRLEQITAGQFA